MKVIDLIKMIDDTYYQDKLPRKVQYNGVEYLCCDDDYPIKYINADGVSLMQELHSINDVVMIIEEPQEHKIPKRIQSNGESLYSEYIGEWLVNTEKYTEYDELLMNKINEILDYLEEIK